MTLFARTLLVYIHLAGRNLGDKWMLRVPIFVLASAFLIFALPIAAQDCPSGTCDDYGPTEEVQLRTPASLPRPKPGGSIIWSATLGRMDADEMRVRFAVFRIGPRDALFVRDREGRLLRTHTSLDPPPLLCRYPASYIHLEWWSPSQNPEGEILVPWAAFHTAGPEVDAVPSDAAFRDATCLKPGNPCANDSWYQSGRAVARIFILRKSGALAQCSGTLIDRQGRKDVLLTARHCLLSASEVFAEFGAEYQPDCTLRTDECLSPQTADCEGVFYLSRTMYLDTVYDWGLVLLSGDPGLTWGTVPMANQIPAVNDYIYMFHHAIGHCKEWDDGFVNEMEPGSTSMRYYGIQSGGGASGSSLRRASDNRIIGVHVSSNTAVALNAILPVLDPVINTLVHSAGPPPGVNVATRSTRVETSSNFGPEWTGWYAIDGIISPESKWTSQNVEPPHWLKLDLGQEYDVTGFVLYNAPAAGEQSVFNPKILSFQSAPAFDGPWTDEFYIHNQFRTDNILYRGYPNVTKRLRYIRLYLEDPSTSDNYARVPEFQVFAAGVSNKATFIAH